MFLFFWVVAEWRSQVECNLLKMLSFWSVPWKCVHANSNTDQNTTTVDDRDSHHWRSPWVKKIECSSGAVYVCWFFVSDNCSTCRGFRCTVLKMMKLFKFSVVHQQKGRESNEGTLQVSCSDQTLGTKEVKTWTHDDDHTFPHWRQPWVNRPQCLSLAVWSLVLV